MLIKVLNASKNIDIETLQGGSMLDEVRLRLFYFRTTTFRPKSGPCLIEKLHIYSHATFGLSVDLISSPKGKAKKSMNPFTPDGA